MEPVKKQTSGWVIPNNITKCITPVEGVIFKSKPSQRSSFLSSHEREANNPTNGGSNNNSGHRQLETEKHHWSCRISEAFDKGFLWLGHFVRPLASRADVVYNHKRDSSTQKSTQLQLVCSESETSTSSSSLHDHPHCADGQRSHRAASWPCLQFYSNFEA